MSWDQYMTTLSGYTGDKLYYGGIFSLSEGNVWTTKGPVNISKDEAKVMAKICGHSGPELSKAQCEGIILGGNKFRFLRSDCDEKSVTFTRNEGEMLHNGYAIQTKQAVIICVCEEEAKGNAASLGTFKLAEYLCSVGY